MMRGFLAAGLTVAAWSVPVTGPAAAQAPAARDYPDRVEIRRTAYGVPHILAEDVGALGYGLAWVQLEDHGRRVVLEQKAPKD